jgi:hypothetical protein
MSFPDRNLKMQYTINFVGEDDYYFTAPTGTAQYDLGFCATEAELIEAVNLIVKSQDPGFAWDDWTTKRYSDV